MIELRRVRLVNWHNFSDDLLELKQVTYMVGVNAVGKTTIMDAIRYCLTTSKDFNALGNKKSGRTLLGSVHGKQRGNNIYTRPGHTVSYIGTEFWNSSNRETFVIVVRVESESPEQEMRHVQQTWFVTPDGCTLEKLPFIDPKTRQPTKREQFRLLDGRMPPIDKHGMALDRICRVLGVGRSDSPLGKKFAAVFQMGTSLDEIPDFRSFICDYVLPQPEINLEDLQQDQVELERLQGVLDEAKEKAAQLVEIVKAGELAKEKQADVDINDGFIRYAILQEAATRESEAIAVLEQCNRQEELLMQRRQELEHQEETAHQRYMEADRAASENDESRMLELLRAQRKDKKTALLVAEGELKKLQAAEKGVEGLLNSAAAHGITTTPELQLQTIQQLPLQNRLQPLERLTQHVKQMLPEAETLFQALVRENGKLEDQKKGLQQTIRVLEGGHWLYPDSDRANAVKESINTALRQHGMEPDARILCELLFMTDVVWQDGVEACLGNRRFDILVSPRHYQVAKRAFREMGEAVGRISLLDTPALERDGATPEKGETDSLSTKVSSENPLVVAYVGSLLGNIVCCEDADELERYKHSVTADLLRHYPYRLERMGRPRQFVGLDARKRQLLEAKKGLQQVAKQHGELEPRYHACEALRNSCNVVVYGDTLRHLLDYWDAVEKQSDAWQQFTQLDSKIREFEENPLLKGALQRADTARKEWESIKAKRETVGGDIRICTDKAKSAQMCQIQAVADSDAANEQWEKYCQKHGVYQDEIERKHKESAKKYTSKETVVFQKNRHNQFEKARDAFVNNTLIPLQQKYNGRYTCDLPTGIAGVEPFRQQYEELISTDLERFSATLQRAQDRCKERFRKDILYHMKDDIANAKRQFKELNQIMEKLSYGEELYRFDVDGSSNPQYNRFYNLIIDKNNLQMTKENTLDNAVATQDAVYEAEVDELMERIMWDIQEKSKARQEGKKVTTQLSQYVDYRTYLDYDIRVTNRETGVQVSLSTVSRDSSGGENQAPFYIAICASLLQIYQKSEQSIRLVLLDEAFSKMTSDRIRPMMEMFRRMQLQILLITTVEKSSAVYPHCDAIYSIIKKGARNAVTPFILEEK